MVVVVFLFSKYPVINVNSVPWLDVTYSDVCCGFILFANVMGS